MVWQESFTNHRIRDEEDYDGHIDVYQDESGEGGIGGTGGGLSVFVSGFAIEKFGVMDLGGRAAL